MDEISVSAREVAFKVRQEGMAASLNGRQIQFKLGSGGGRVERNTGPNPTTFVMDAILKSFLFLVKNSHNFSPPGNFRSGRREKRNWHLSVIGHWVHPLWTFLGGMAATPAQVISPSTSAGVASTTPVRT
jgi:hypothetical protein